MESYFSSFKLSKGKNYFLICYSLVSGGKSTFYNYILDFTKKDEFKNNFNVFYVSSDQVRDELAKEFQKKNQELTYQECFDKVGKNTAKEFDKRIKNFLRLSKKDKINLYLIDKNFPQGIDKFLNSFVKHEKNNNFVIVFIPKIKNQININENHIYYPFSIDYIMQCYLRLKHRKGHENLNGNDQNSRNVYLSFLKLFKGFNFENNIYSENQYQKNIQLREISFTDEDNNIDFNEVHQNFFKNVLNKIKPFDMNSLNNEFKDDINNYLNYIEANYDEKNVFKDTRNIIENEVLDFLKSDSNDNNNNIENQENQIKIENEEQKLNEVINTFFKAIELKDIKLIDEIFSKNKKCSLIVFNKEFNEIESIKNDFILEGIAKKYKEIKLNPFDIKTDKIDNQNVYIKLKFKVEGILLENEEKNDFEGFGTYIITLENNEWKLVYIHYSK